VVDPLRCQYIFIKKKRALLYARPFCKSSEYFLSTQMFRRWPCGMRTHAATHHHRAKSLIFHFRINAAKKGLFSKEEKQFFVFNKIL